MGALLSIFCNEDFSRFGELSCLGDVSLGNMVDTLARVRGMGVTQS